MASNLLAMASNLIAMASNLLAMASNLLAMASNLIAMASNLLAMASNLIAMASNLIAMASNLIAMASDLIAMASNLIAMENWFSFVILLGDLDVLYCVLLGQRLKFQGQRKIIGDFPDLLLMEAGYFFARQYFYFCQVHVVESRCHINVNLGLTLDSYVFCKRMYYLYISKELPGTRKHSSVFPIWRGSITHLNQSRND